MAYDLRIELVDSPEDFGQFFHCAGEAFGRQVADAIWIAMNPGWDTLSGRAAGAARLCQRWAASSHDEDGHLTTMFLKATLPTPEGTRVIAGCAIWVQASCKPGRGIAPPSDADMAASTRAIYPDNETEVRFATQVDRGLHRQRNDVLRDIAGSESPAAFVLDLCAVDPMFQRKGIARALVQWGLDEARRRGGLEAMMEASTAGRLVYQKMGFMPDGEASAEYGLDEEFSGRDLPNNLFMRTGRP